MFNLLSKVLGTASTASWCEALCVFSILTLITETKEKTQVTQLGFIGLSAVCGGMQTSFTLQA